MSKLDELIQELCPNGVEFVPLWSITAWDKKFNAVDKAMQPKVYKYPVLLAKDLFAMQQEKGDVFLLSTGTETGWTTEKIAGDYLCKGEVVTLPWGKSSPVKGLIKYYNGKFVTGDNRIATSLDTEKLLNKYLYYWMVNQGDVIDTFYRGSGIKHPSMFHVLTMTIPVPPMEVQREIVRLLDDFTAKTAELQAELNKEYEARKKQYEYYRETVLNDNLDSMTVKIGDVADLKAGATPKTSNPEFWENGTIPWMSSGEVNQGKVTYTEKKITELGYNSSSTKMLPSETVVIALAGQGKTRGTVAITQIPLCTNQSLCGICAKDELNSMYLYHYLKSRYEDLRAISNGDGTRGGLNLKMIANYDIPLPPLEVQMKIVNILDKLDSINNDMYSSINNEIESRQKQYEFYRDKLLTFKELK
ncbi:restriction endonuclease subunit S [Holdemanella porci]|uniref:restriction endonuclease subunit S n=1 Tax=Holdemanella porci TaxID=2652276 RepID=UPI003F9328A2